MALPHIALVLKIKFGGWSKPNSGPLVYVFQWGMDLADVLQNPPDLDGLSAPIALGPFFQGLPRFRRRREGCQRGVV